ncbi:MAG: sulfatase-like hydrolase/transferase [Synergistaceae bacterium]|nr:sulfatase-like hydrolase/transferase [Synergistaceae bacterium]
MKKMNGKKDLALTLTAAGLAASVIAASGGCGGSSTKNARINGNYNILFVVVDQEHFFKDYPAGTSWRAREMLREMGTTFEKHYACSNMSTSSRSTLFTGTHIPETGMIDNTDFPWQDAMNDALVTIGDRMREAGYYTALKGKWHMADSTIQGGGELDTLEGYGFADWGGTDYIGSVWQGHEKDPIVVSEAMDWLGGKGKALNAAGTPFFLAVTMINPHDIMDYDITGYQSPTLHLGGKPDSPVYDATYSEPVPSTWNFDLNAADVPEAVRMYYNNWSIIAGKLTTQELWKDYQNYYFNCIQDSDNNLMKLLDSLEENGMMDNTIIVMTADHGEMHGSHGLKGKGGFIYENNIHIPLIIVHPDYKGGRTVSAVTSNLDLAATFVDMASLTDARKTEISKGLRGNSLVPLMSGAKSSIREGALFCYEMLSMSAALPGKIDYADAFKNHMGRGMARGIITEDGYKFIRHFKPLEFNKPAMLEELFASNDVQVFNLRADPDETNNLASEANREANAALIADLNGRLNALIEKEIGADTGAEVAAALKKLSGN